MLEVEIFMRTKMLFEEYDKGRVGPALDWKLSKPIAALSTGKEFLKRYSSRFEDLKSKVLGVAQEYHTDIIGENGKVGVL